LARTLRLHTNLRHPQDRVTCPLAGTIATIPLMWATARRSRRSLDQLVARAHEGGRLRADVTPLDIAWPIELFGRFGPLGDDSIVRQRLLALAIDGLSTSRQKSPLPAQVRSQGDREQVSLVGLAALSAAGGAAATSWLRSGSIRGSSSAASRYRNAGRVDRRWEPAQQCEPVMTNVEEENDDRG
jgi:hypothetical protein